MSETGLPVAGQTHPSYLQPTSGTAASQAVSNQPRVLSTAEQQQLQRAEHVKEQLAIIFRNLPSSVKADTNELPFITTQYLIQLKETSLVEATTFNRLLQEAYGQEMQRRGFSLPAHSYGVNLLDQLRESLTAQVISQNQQVSSGRRRGRTSTSIDMTSGATRSRRAIDEDSTILYTLIAAQIDRLESYDTELEGMVQDMETLTAFLDESRTVLSLMYDAKPSSGSTAALPNDAIAFMAVHSISRPAVGQTLTDTQFQSYITSVESLVEQNNNESQLQIFQLQQVTGYRNQIYELITNTFSRIIRIYDAIINNFKI